MLLKCFWAKHEEKGAVDFAWVCFAASLWFNRLMASGTFDAVLPAIDDNSYDRITHFANFTLENFTQ